MRSNIGFHLNTRIYPFHLSSLTLLLVLQVWTFSLWLLLRFSFVKLALGLSFPKLRRDVICQDLATFLCCRLPFLSLFLNLGMLFVFSLPNMIVSTSFFNFLLLLVNLTKLNLL
ncbi:hypothetical protein V8G54_024997 [Vigna mungo]|uniref:Transmembrane protein n=1 Tax=Vigna mungo TaxID=3915 RepID=A0AAQ3N8B8_VIGMU